MIKNYSLTLGVFLCFASVLFAQEKSDTVFSSNGNISQITQVDGAKVYKTRYNYKGVKSKYTVYENGAKVKEIHWNRRGEIQSEANFIVDTVKGNKNRVVKHGPQLRFHPTGKVKSSTHFSYGKLDGLSESFYYNGKKKSVKEYQNGLGSGIAKGWFEDGSKHYEKNFKVIRTTNRYKIKRGKYFESVMHGVQLEYFKNGKKKSFRTYSEGKKDGKYQVWYENGKKKEVGLAKGYYKYGKIKQWRRNGKLSSSMEKGLEYDSTSKRYSSYYIGKVIRYYENGNLKSLERYKNKKKHGKQEYYYVNKKLSKRVEFVYGAKIGKEEAWDLKGRLSSVTTYAEKPNEEGKEQRDGLSIRFTNNHRYDTLSFGYYKQGKKEGVWKKWNGDGKLKSIEHYQNGKLSGPFKRWHGNGKLKDEGACVLDTLFSKKSKLHGESKEYYKSGMLKSTQFYNYNESYHIGKLFTESGEVYTQSLGLYTARRRSNYTTKNSRVILKFYDNKQLSSLTLYRASKQIWKFEFYRNGNPKRLEDGLNHKNEQAYLWDSEGKLIYVTKERDTDYNPGIEDRRKAGVYYKALQGVIDQKLDLDVLVKSREWELKFGEITLIKASFRNNYLNGKLSVNHINGFRLFQYSMRDGQPIGNVKHWGVNDTLSSEGEMENGLREGEWKYYYTNGNISQKDLYLRGKSQSYKKYYKSGTVKESGVIDPRNGNNFKRDYFYENGQVKSKRYILSAEENRDSTVSYYENGNLKGYRIMKNNIKDGFQMSTYEDGTIRYKVSYKGYRQNGPCYYYHKNGQLSSRGNYKNGRKDGEFIHYDEEGNFKYSKNFRKGILLYNKSHFECSCVDSTITQSNIFPMSAEVHKPYKDIRKWLYDFHAPIKESYESAFFKIGSMNTDRNGNFRFWGSLISYSPLYMDLPNRKGIRLVFNPCKSGNAQKSNLNISCNVNDPNSFSAELDVQKLSVEFKPRLLKQWDLGANKPLRDQEQKHVGATMLFNAKQVRYNYQDELRIDGVDSICFTESEIGNTGFLIDFDKMYLDLWKKKNPREMDYHMPKNFCNDLSSDMYSGFSGRSSQQISKKFVGVFVPEAKLTLPDNLLKGGSRIKTTAKNVTIGGRHVVGVFGFKGVQGKGLSYRINVQGKTVLLDEKEFVAKMKALGFKTVRLEYNNSLMELNIYFQYLMK